MIISHPLISSATPLLFNAVKYKMQVVEVGGNEVK
jgi:hypothetical protein